jgi:hypothetical protein
MSLHPRFVELEKQTKAFDERDDCTVKAVAVVCDIDYKDAHELLAHYGRKHRKGAVDCETTWPALNSLGVKMVEVKLSSLPKHPKTIRTLERVIPKNGKYLVNVRGHIVAISDGEVIDWTRDRCYRITSLYKIVYT